MAGTVNSWNNQINGSYNQIVLNAGTNGVAISTDASNATVNVATGAAVKTATFGSTNTTSATTVQSGSGALNVTSTNGALTINSGTGTLAIGNDATNATMNIGTGAATKTITIGNTTGGSTTINCPSFQCSMSSSEMINTYSGANSTGSFIQLRKNRSGGVISANDICGTINAWGHDGTTYIQVGALSWQSIGSIATNQIGSVFTISTHPQSTSSAATRLTIASTGAVTIAAPDSGTGLTISGGGSSTTGRADFANGISFDSGTNTLSTFVTSTSWTPNLTFGGGSTGLTYTTQQGTYTRIGNMVFAQLNITLSNKGSSTGNMSISGLPFTIAQTTIGTVSGTVTWTAGNVIVSSFAAGGTSLVVNQVSPTVGTPTALTDTSFTNTTTLRISGIYFV